MVQYLEGNNGVEKGNVNRTKTSDAIYKNSYYKESNKYNICKTIIEFGKEMLTEQRNQMQNTIIIDVKQ